MSANVIFLDDNEDLRVMMTSILKVKLGLNCLCFSGVQDFISAGSKVLESQLVILDMNLGNGGNGLDAYDWLQAQKYNGKVFFLTGYDKSNPSVSSAQARGVEIYQKPLATDRLISLVECALNFQDSKLRS